MAAKQFNKFVVNDLNYLFRRLELLPDLLSLGLLLNRSNKVFRNFVVNVGFQERQADFAEGRVHMFLPQHAFAAKIL